MNNRLRSIGWLTTAGNAMLVSILAAVFFEACSGDSAKPAVRETAAMNTYVTISIYDGGHPREKLEALLDSAVAEINRVERMASDYIDSSEIGRINAAAGKDTVAVSHELVELLRVSLAYGDSSGGSFDVTVGPLVKAWDILSSHPRVPPPEEIRNLLPLINYRLVAIRGDRVYLPQKGMALDLGAIGKGYAVDCALKVLGRNGLKNMIVDIGGNLGVRWEGTRGLDSAMATISVRHPRKDGAFLGSFRYGSGGVSTSGDYQRCFFSDGVRYHHIMDPATGYPARDVVSVTIVGPTATEADALSTLVFVLGREKGMAFIREIPGVDCIIVSGRDDSLAVDCSPGFAGKFLRDRSHD
jgi:thiamine biosynthesis lipoprotein